MRGRTDLRVLIASFALLATACQAGPRDMKSSTEAYGSAEKQVLDIYWTGEGPPAPLILFIHGGGWSMGSKKDGESGQPGYFVTQGYAYASLDYRLVPDVKVEDQLSDVARALRWLVKHGRAFNIDTRRIILVGHSSGAHLAALIATDADWLKRAGVPFDWITGVVSLDGAGIDVPGIMAAGAITSHFYADAFGAEVARQTRLSPQAHVGLPDAPRWLFLYDQAHNPAAGFFAERFAQSVRQEGGAARVVAIPDTTHMRMLSTLGKEENPATIAVDAFLKEAIGPRNARPQ